MQRPHPPILIGAGGEQLALCVVAEHADIWNCPSRGGIAEFRRKSAVLDDHCRAIGRDPSEIVRSVQVLVASGDDTGTATGGRQTLPTIAPPSVARELLVEFIGAGARHLVLAPIPPFPSVRWLADEIVEPVMAAVG